MVSISQIRRIAWSIYWKTTLTGVVGGFVAGSVIGFVIGFSGTLAGFDRSLVMQTSQIVGFVAGLAVSFLCLNYFLARSIGRVIGGKRLELIVAEGV